MTGKILILYHANCLDGFAAAFAAWVKFGDTAEYIPVNYGDEPPDATEKEVYILDFSYKRDILLRMEAKAKFLIVLDHHKSAQEDLSDLLFAVFDMNRSGCVMAWEYFHHSYSPSGLLMIQDRDLWQFKIPGTKAFNAALRAFIEPTFSAWSAVLSSGINTTKLIERGQDLLEVFDKDVLEIAKRKHKITLSGYEGLACCATPKYASELGNKLALESGTFGAVYSFDGGRKEWQFSLRSAGEFDVSAIAKDFNGGGHKNASGFATKQLLTFTGKQNVYKRPPPRHSQGNQASGERDDDG